MKDERISLSSDIIKGMKSIKYLCLENICGNKINKIRDKEFIYLGINRVLDGFISIFWNCINYILLYYFLITYLD